MQLDSSGVYTDTLISVFGQDSIVTLTLTVNEISISISNDTITATGSGIIQWMDCSTGGIISGVVGNTFVSSIAGSYAAIITNTSCKDTTDCVSYTGISNKLTVNSNQLTVYPNPVSSLVTIKYQTTNSGKSTVTVENCLGQVMLTQNLKSETRNTVIDMSCYASGMYFIKCFDGRQQRVVKVVKE